jgi:acyl-CoA thioesterase
MTAPFLTATTPTPLSEGLYRCRFEAAWNQGKGAYGGVVAGLLLRALEHHLGDTSRPVRSLTVHFCAPASGEAELHTRLERSGRLVTHATARMQGPAGPLAVASATFGAARGTGPTYLEAQAPKAPAPESVPSLPEDAPAPDFCRFFDYRYCLGAAPFSGGDVAHVGGWVRPREPLVLDSVLCVGLLDSFPPSVFSRMDGYHAGASVDFTVHFFHALPRPGTRAEAWYLRTGRSRQASEGFAEDLQELWTDQGELLAQCRQLVALL